ncbi:hypothetical protein ES707_11025 [subsurface metagenome]
MSDNPAEAVDRGCDLASYISRTGKMLADAKIHKDKAMNRAALELYGNSGGMPPSTLNELIKSSIARENYLVNWLDRLNRSATHQLEWCRSLVSKAKEEMKYAGGVNG